MTNPLNPSSSPTMNPGEEQDKAVKGFIQIPTEPITSYSKNIIFKRMVLLKAGTIDSSNKSKPSECEKPIKAGSKFEKPRFVSKLTDLFSRIRSTGSPKMSGRPMKYPYTYTAKIVQFPWKFYYKNNWMFKYYLFAVVASFPIFYKIGKLSRSPENVKTWEEIRKKEFTPGTHH